MPVVNDFPDLVQIMLDRIQALENRDRQRETQTFDRWTIRENDAGVLVATTEDGAEQVLAGATVVDEETGEAEPVVPGEGGDGGGTGDCDCPPGPEGPQGPPGETGATGDCSSCPAGPEGPEGDSAYQVAVDEGFVGTEADWLASLVGAAGPTGPAGPPGTTFAPTFGAFTPTWTATVANPVLGNGSRVGRYFQAGEFVRGNIKLTAGSTTTFGSGGFRFAAPTNIQDSGVAQIVPVGTCVIRDNSTGTNFHRFVVSDATNLLWIVDQAGNQVNATTPMTWAQNDYLVIQFAYESA